MGTLIDNLTSLAAPSVGDISRRLGENDASVSRGLRSSLACVLAGLVTRTKDPTSIRQVFDLLAGRTSASAAAPIDMKGLVDNLTAGMPPQGASGTLLTTLFGSRTGAVGDLVTRTVGFRNASSGSTLLGLSAPMVLGYLGNKVRENGLNSVGLSRMLLEERESVLAAAPPGLVGLVETSAAQRLEAGEAFRSVAMAGGRPVRANGASSGNRWLLPILGIAAAAIVVFSMNHARRPSTSRVGDTRVATSEPGASRAEVTQAGGALGDFVRRTLPGGAVLIVPERGVETKLIVFIEDAARPVNDTTWFDFDRLNFATGSATILPESREQLANIAAVLHAYPGVSVKIGGYTDNVGDAAANKTLSERRATTVLDELVSRGVAKNRLQAEGYGEQHPVASNSTPEGRARNRRIALKVTKK